MFYCFNLAFYNIFERFRIQENEMSVYAFVKSRIANLLKAIETVAKATIDCLSKFNHCKSTRED